VLFIVGVLAGWQLYEIADIRTRYAIPIRILAGVTWTLRYEWVFYFSLILTSQFSRTILSGFLFPVASMLLASLLLYFDHDNIPLAALLMFSVGMAAAALKQMSSWNTARLPQWLMSAGALLGPLAVLLFFDGIYKTVPILILGLSFSLVVFDATVFGLLLTKPARRLGNISYGIYLLQGPVFFLIFGFAPLRSFAMTSPMAHWAIVVIAATILIMFATMTHVLIERPGIKAGQRVWAMLRESGWYAKPAPP
jgi:peptidoglycan/LPS O-acetylase OafA/YrhL